MSKTKNLFIFMFLILIAVLSLGLVACGESDEDIAAKVDLLIEELPEDVGLSSEELLSAARTAYNALTAEQKELVKKLAKLQEKEDVIVNIKAANIVVKKVNDLPVTITLTNETEVVGARAAYDALTESQKTLVANYSKLEDAEAEIVKLKEQKANQEAANIVISLIADFPETLTLEHEELLDFAKEAYDALTTDQKILVTNYKLLDDAKIDIDAAKVVFERISQFPEEMKLTDKVLVLGARVLYDRLSADQKTLVSNYNKLEAAESIIEELELVEADIDAAKLVDDMIDALPVGKDLKLEDEEDVIAARTAYNELTTEQKEYVESLEALNVAETGIEELKEKQKQQQDEHAAFEVDLLILNLPAFVLIEDKEDVMAVRAAYEALTEVQKEYVYNLSYLEEKEDRITNLELAKPVENLISALSEEITIDDEEDIVAARAAYDALSPEVQVLVNNLDRLIQREKSLYDIKFPELAALRDATKDVPKYILDDYVLPNADGTITWDYKEGSDTSHYDLATGKLLKLSLDQVKATLIASIGEYEFEREVTFGLFAEGQSPIYYTGATKPAGGNTADGFGTYETQIDAVGFGGFTITFGNKVFFIGENSYIPLQGTEENELLERATLRPLGLSSDTDCNNTGLKKGKIASYAGAAALYHNASEYTITFNASDTYGRLNVPTYGFGKLVFKLNDDGNYVVQRYLDASSADGDALGTVGTVMVTLEPGDMLWTPHSYEVDYADAGYGTKLHQEHGGILVQGSVIEIRKYNMEMFLNLFTPETE